MSAQAHELEPRLGKDVATRHAELRAQFPILERRVGDKPLVYLDNAATTQKPQTVIECEAHYYRHYNANIHRGVHRLSQEATDAYEQAREKVRAFINAGSTREIVYVRGTTEAINLVAHGFAQSELSAGDEVLVSAMEHHSNIVPWQLACQRSGARLRIIPIDSRGELIMEALPDLITERTRLLALVHVSNALGTINPVAEVIDLAHRRGVPVLLDGAQALPHIAVDVRALDCDFYAFSGHKAFGPTGIGVLYGKEAWLDRLPPYQGGGDMIKAVRFEETLYNELPYKFEAGTPNIAGGIGLGAAIDFLSGLGMQWVSDYESGLMRYATERAEATPGLRQIGTARDKAGVLSFTLEGIHPHDIGTVLDHEGVAIRTGHHCAMPVMDFFEVPATARASFALYNTAAEIDALFEALAKVRELFG